MIAGHVIGTGGGAALASIPGTMQLCHCMMLPLMGMPAAACQFESGILSGHGSPWHWADVRFM